MTTDELEQFLDRKPFRPVVLVLSSGDRVVVRTRADADVGMLTVLVKQSQTRFGDGDQMISVPNIAMVTEWRSGPPEPRRRR